MDPVADDLNSLYEYSLQPGDETKPVKEKSIHESHCDKCFSSKRCQEMNILGKNGADGVISCRIVQCRLICGHEFHACKHAEHELLCPNVKVPCINVDNGCPVIMERRLRAKHLHTCPASVIVCTMEWNRWPQVRQEDLILKGNDDSTQLDLVFLQRDERTAVEWKANLPSRLRNRLKTPLNVKHPVMPLGVSGHRIPYCIATENLVEKGKRSHSTSENSDSLGSLLDHKINPPGLQQSVCNTLAQSSVPVLVGSQSKVDAKVEEEEDGNVFLNLVVEVVPRSKLKPTSLYTFMCAREFRRDEYATHFRSIHSDIITQLNGWLFRRCPMANQGCSFGVERMYPHSSEHRVVYNGCVDAFCTTQIENNNIKDSYVAEEESDKPPSLCDLPFEVLVHLSAYIDPLSLSALSMTNSLLRDVCSLVVVKRGIVVLQWEKNEQCTGWKIMEKKWLFSTSFSPVPKWSFGEIGRLSNHMKECTYFERQIADKPFCYPVELKDL